MQLHMPASADSKGSPARVIGLVMALFFAFGFCTVLVDTIIPKLKATFALSYAEVMLTQFCFFGAYFLVSLPAAWLHSRIGYLQGVAVGLLLMALGCLLFTPAANAGIYPGFLLALFILAAGVTIVQVAANPLATGAGDPQRAASRLTLPRRSILWRPPSGRSSARRSFSPTVLPFPTPARYRQRRFPSQDASRPASFKCRF